MPGAYEIRAADAGKSKKQSMADLKLRRLNELNSRLKEDLERPRIKVSEASMSLVHLICCRPPYLGRREAGTRLISNDALQVNTILHKHQRLHGTINVGLCKWHAPYMFNAIARAMRLTALTMYGSLTCRAP